MTVVTGVFGTTQYFRFFDAEPASSSNPSNGAVCLVDDQVEWLDDDTILYGLHVEGSEGELVQPEFDVWSLDIAPDAQPELLAPQADSPAVRR